MQSCRVQQESGCSTKLGIPEGPQLAGSGRELDPGDSALSWARVPVFGERARKAGARVEQRVAKHHQERQEGRASSRRLERPLWERGLKAEGEAPSGREMRVHLDSAGQARRRASTPAVIRGRVQSKSYKQGHPARECGGGKEEGWARGHGWSSEGTGCT